MHEVKIVCDQENLGKITYCLLKFLHGIRAILIIGAIANIEAIEFCAGGIRICSSVFLVSKLRCLSTDCDWSMPLRAARIILHGRTGWRWCWMKMG